MAPGAQAANSRAQSNFWFRCYRTSTIKGFEVMRALRKKQASAFNLTHDIRGEARIVERAFRGRRSR